MVKFSIKLLPLMGVVLLLSAIGFFLLKSEKEDVEELSHDETVPSADISAEKFNITQIDTDKGTKWTLGVVKGDYSEKSGEEKTARLERFSLDFQQKQGINLELEGNGADYNRAENEVTLEGEITGKTSNGYMFFTEQMVISLNENRLKTDETVTLFGPFFSMTGRGFFMDLKKETLKILKDGKSIFDKESLNI